jgi:hypothetical protein
VWLLSQGENSLVPRGFDRVLTFFTYYVSVN